MHHRNKKGEKKIGWKVPLFASHVTDSNAAPYVVLCVLYRTALWE